MIKRWLPQSGRYRLEDYLPMFLWFNHHKTRGHNLFWSVLELLSRNMSGPTLDSTISDEYVQSLGENVEVESDDLSENEENVPPVVQKKMKESRPIINCFFCGEKFKGEGAVKRHLHYCKKNPMRD